MQEQAFSHFGQKAKKKKRFFEKILKRVYLSDEQSSPTQRGHYAECENFSFPLIFSMKKVQKPIL